MKIEKATRNAKRGWYRYDGAAGGYAAEFGPVNAKLAREFAAVLMRNDDDEISEVCEVHRINLHGIDSADSNATDSNDSDTAGDTDTSNATGDTAGDTGTSDTGTKRNRRSKRPAGKSGTSGNGKAKAAADADADADAKRARADAITAAKQHPAVVCLAKFAKVGTPAAVAQAMVDSKCLKDNGNVNADKLAGVLADMGCADVGRDMSGQWRKCPARMPADAGAVVVMSAKSLAVVRRRGTGDDAKYEVASHADITGQDAKMLPWEKMQRPTYRVMHAFVPVAKADTTTP